MSKDPTTPPPTISEAELFEEFRKGEIVHCDTRGNVKYRQAVESYLNTEYSHIEISMDGIEDDPSDHLECIRDDLVGAASEIEKLIEAFEDLKTERHIEEGVDGDWGRYLAAPEKEGVMTKGEMENVEVEVPARTIVGRYRSDSGIVTVFYDGCEKATQIGDLPEEMVAKMLLRELAG
ncbi:MAG: hypothetical protein ACK4S3_06475 [Parvibaculum sp.]